MREPGAPFVPPHCPNPHCRFHKSDRHLWRFVRNGTFTCKVRPFPVQRFRCDTCRRYFSTQTFEADYWLKRPDLQPVLLRLIVTCAGYRQLGRALGVSPETVAGQVARLGRHSLLFHEVRRAKGPVDEPLALDSFESFEFSQYHPSSFHLVAGRRSHFFYGFTDSELRRKGRMTRGQRRRREEIEREVGRPDPRSVEVEVAELLKIVAARSARLELHTDEHPAYPRSLGRLHGLEVDHRTISSRAARTPQNPLFAINLLDLLIRHTSANHKRETIAFSKRRQGAIERLWCFLTWRNYGKWFSERRAGESPAMRLGLARHLLSVEEVLSGRLFPGRIRLPRRWAVHYRRGTPTRRIARIRLHERKYAF